MRRDQPPIDVRIRAIYRERWRRVVVMSGELDGVLIYNGMGHGESIFFNGKKQFQTSTWSMRTVFPFAEFYLPARGGDLWARIDVAASMWPWRFGITDFRLSIEGEMLYDERRGEYWIHDDSALVTKEPYEEDY